MREAKLSEGIAFVGVQSAITGLLDLLHKYFFVSRRGAEAQRKTQRKMRKERLLQEVYCFPSLEHQLQRFGREVGEGMRSCLQRKSSNVPTGAAIC